MLIPTSEWQTIRQRAQLPAFEAVIRRLRHDVEVFLAQPVAVPSEPGGYYHDYFCPQHGVQLTFDPTSPYEHRCPVDGAIHRGASQDAAWRWSANNLLSQSAMSLAVLWRLEGNHGHLAQATAILMGYAERYPDFLTGIQSVPNPGVATYTTLDESAWVLPLSWAFDLIRDSLAAKEVENITDRLLTLAAGHLVRHHFHDIHNFSCWHNAAIGTLGLVLNRQDLIEFAIHGEFGFDAQLRDGVLTDGLWYEGSFSYHFFALTAFLALAKAACHTPELDLRDRLALRAMLHAPIRCEYPDGSLPATNDCWYFTSLTGECCHGVPPAAAFYEIGYAWYGDAPFAQVLHRAYGHGPRDNLDALLFGKDTIPATEMESLPSAHLASSGYAILRSPAPATLEDGSPAEFGMGVEEQRYLLLKYGPHGGGHGHPDKLSQVLYDHGRRLSPDLGTPGYGLDEVETWYRQTLSHNTVMIDGLTQLPATGNINNFRGEGEFQVADAAVSWDEGAYEGVTMRRVLLARPDYFLDVFLVECDRTRRIDWIYRNVGACDVSLDFNPLVAMDAEMEGNKHISNARRAITDSDFAARWQADGAGLQLFVAGQPASEITAGTVPGNPPTDLYSIIVHHRRAVETAYISVFHSYQHSPLVTSVEWIGSDLLEAGWAGCIVNMAEVRELWLIRQISDAVAPSWSGGEKVEVDAQFEYSLG